MSTVDKITADKVMAGEFPEDNITAILRYENAFNGNFAYKLIFAHQDCKEYRNYLLTQCPALHSPEIIWELSKSN